MTIQRIDCGPRMSQAVIHGGTAYLAGQVALDTPDAPIAEQTRNVLSRIDDLLAKVGSSKENILSATIWLADMSTFGEMNEVWDAWVPQGHTPARAAVEAKLAAPRFGVEIMVVAAI